MAEKWITINESGNLEVPPDIAAQYGLVPGAQLRIETSSDQLRLHRPVTNLAKVYIEPTDLCNLDCTMCIRHSWDESMGRMSEETFQSILTALSKMDPIPTVFFGGLGEPLYNPKTIDWIGQVKQLGGQVELITNGTILNEKVSKRLIDAGLDVLWVSIDGASPESYADIRLGGAFPQVIENLTRFQRMRPGGHKPYPKIGISFVAMKRNIHDLPKILKISRKVGASFFLVTNVFPYTAEMQDEMLYTRTLKNITYISSQWLPQMELPKMDIDELTRDVFFEALNSGFSVNFAGSSLAGSNDVCNFIDRGTTSIAWDGNVSPCWPLMHNHTSYLHGKPHRSRKHVIANVNDRDLYAIWMDQEYLEYRKKVQSFDFAPCTVCGGCDLSEANEEDCIGNEFPACGSCLWSQGLIRCA